MDHDFDPDEDLTVSIKKYLIGEGVGFHVGISPPVLFLSYPQLKQLSEKLAWYIESEEEDAAYDLQSANS